MRFLAIATVLSCATPYAASQVPAPDNAVPKFEKLVAAASTPVAWVLVKQDIKTGIWYKRHYQIRNIKYDVKATDSLLNPMIGIVTFDTAMKVAGSAASEAAAGDLPDATEASLGMNYSMNGRYFFKDAKWKLSEYTYRDTTPGIPRGPLTMTPETIAERNSTVAELLYRWNP